MKSSDAERWTGTLRRGLVDHVVVLRVRRLRKLVRQHIAYYNEDRPHMAPDGDSPAGRNAETAANGDIIAVPKLGGLHHWYSRAE